MSKPVASRRDRVSQAASPGPTTTTAFDPEPMPNVDSPTSMSWVTSGIVFLATLLVGSAVVIGAISVTELMVRSKTPYTPDRTTCECDCWDRAFKGVYYHSHRYQYKAVYFNMTSTTVTLFAWTVFHFALFYKFIELAVSAVVQRRIRWIALVLLGVSYYQMFYNWWATFNYINDSFFALLPTQMFFNLTELVPAISLGPLVRSHSKLVSPLVSAAAMAVAVSHIILSLSDQGWAHLFNRVYNNGWAFLGVRDGMFLAGDLASVLILLAWGGRGKGRGSGIAQYWTTVTVMTGGLMGVYQVVKLVYGYND
ncbi:hypothetical protein BCR44DRAFT_42354 [Catenaria anguillulae PL171]|uniref:Uncharacterized protein n=1 Tax=Catenaria anguillulae PL171 TaxID=765915 RepID=A0A1Y2HLJ0_9FUNG|nr:hypothetical protein BCR44DRAFT_42354 [Catenaria anguillulae PL171]